MSYLGILLVITTLFHIGNAFPCRTTCATPKEITFCSHIGFSTCKKGASWEEQDTEAAVRVEKLFGDDFARLQNTSDPCFDVVRRVECAVVFPSCEVADEATPLCRGACQTAVLNHCDFDHSYCTDLGLPRKKDEKCFPLDYSGPNMGMWVIGFSIAVLFSMLSSLGLNLQKFSMTRDDSSNKPRPPFRQPVWVLGFLLIVLGSILDFVAFGMAPQSLLAPLAALSLVWNMLLAPMFHKEKVTRENMIATAVVIAGVTSTVIFAGHSTPSYELNDLLALYNQWTMIGYGVCVGLFLLSMVVGVRSIETRVAYAHLQGGLLHIVCYGGIAGTFGGQSVLFAKSTVELVKSTLQGRNAFVHAPTYCIVGAMALCLVAQISFLNGGLRRFDALLMVPVYQAFWIIMSVFGGLMYFQEYRFFSPLQSVMFALGALVTMAGIAMLLRTRSQDLVRRTNSGLGLGGDGANKPIGGLQVHHYSELEGVMLDDDVLDDDLLEEGGGEDGLLGGDSEEPEGGGDGLEMALSNTSFGGGEEKDD